MDRRQFLVCSSLLTAGSAIPFKSIWSKTAGNFTPLRRNVGYFTERGGTIGWLASDDGMVIVDSQFPETAKNCLNGLRNRSDHSLDLLINTHHHGDHTSGNLVFKDVAEKMVAHEKVPDLMKKSAEESEEDSSPAYPTTTFAESWQLEVGDETVHARYFGPAHTSGDAVIYFEKANIVHTGDLVFNRMNPYTDRPAGASIQHWIQVLESIEEEYPADAQYVFGHGKPDFGVTGGRQDVTVMRNYLMALIEHVKSGLEQNKSKEEIINIKVLDGFEEFLYADFWTLSQNLAVVHAELIQS